MNQSNLIRRAIEQEMVRHNHMMALLFDLDRNDFSVKNQIDGLQEENLCLKQLANHNDADCRSFADTEHDDDV